ncbi:MAG: glutaredoxin 3 [Pseudomonadota bacterium]
MNSVTIYTKSWCPYCARAKQLLENQGISYTELDVEQDANLLQEMIQRSGRHTVPQVFVGDRHIGGSDDLYAAHLNGDLDRELNASQVIA